MLRGVFGFGSFVISLHFLPTTFFSHFYHVFNKIISKLNWKLQSHITTTKLSEEMGSLKPVYPHFSFEQDYRAKLRFPFQSPQSLQVNYLLIFSRGRGGWDGSGWFNIHHSTWSLLAGKQVVNSWGSRMVEIIKACTLFPPLF